MPRPFTVLLDAPSEAKARLQIAQLGDYNDKRYGGDFSITRDDVEEWSRNLEHLPGKRALIDLDHRADRTPRNTEAAGWITGIGWNGDTPVADVEWTPVGKQAIEDKRYLFFSPTYGRHKTEDGAVHDNTLIGGALTNRPFLTGMPAITLASDETVGRAVEELEAENNLRLLDTLTAKRRQPTAVIADSRRAMDAQDLIKTLDLADTADDTQILQALAALKESASKADKLERKLSKNPVKTLEQQAKDAGLVVLDAAALRQLEANASDGAEARKQLHEQRFDTTFEKALTDPAGARVTPAERDSLKHFYTLDADATVKLIEERDAIVSARPVGSATIDLSQEDADPQEVMAAGLHPGQHTLHQQIEKHMREKDLPRSAYVTVLDQYSRGEITF